MANSMDPEKTDVKVSASISPTNSMMDEIPNMVFINQIYSNPCLIHAVAVLICPFDHFQPLNSYVLALSENMIWL